MSSESTIEKEDAKARAAKRAAEEAAERDEDEDEDDDDEPEARPEPRQTSSKEKVILDRPSSAKVVGIIASREIAAYMNSAITYVVVAVSFIIFGLWFFLYKGGFWQVDRATMQRAIENVPLGLCVVVPLFTMRSLSDEKRVGTIELLITMPVKDTEVILGKYFGALAIMIFQLGLFALYPIAMFKWPWHIGELDWNPFWVGMLGLTLFSAAATAIGMMWSSFTESQILSYFAGLITLVVLYGIGSVTVVEFMNTSNGWSWLGDGIAFVSLQSRFEAFSRGIVDTRAIIYFLSITTLCLMVAFRSLESRKWT
jgi:gliding motility-associated transport system permease protein